jgi:hypothetical protein
MCSLLRVPHTLEDSTDRLLRHRRELCQDFSKPLDNLGIQDNSIIAVKGTSYAPGQAIVLVKITVTQIGVVQGVVYLKAFPLPLDTRADGNDPIERQGKGTSAVGRS